MVALSFEHLPPVKHDISQLPFSLTTRDAAAWLVRRPLANAKEAIKEIYGMLRTTNRCRMPAKERLAVLTAFQPYNSYIVNALSKHYEGVRFPLEARGRGIADLVMELNRENANGYMQVINDSAVSADSGQGNHVLSAALCFAMYYLGRLQEVECQVYMHHAEQVWLDIYRLYRFAEEHGLHKEQQVHQYAIGEEQPMVLLDKFKKILLMSKANESRLPADRIAAIHAFVKKHIVHISIVSSVDSNSQEGQFMITLNEGHAPFGYDPQQHELDADMRVLNTTRLVHALDQQLAKLTTGQVKEELGLEHSLVERLLRSWRNLNARFSIRSKRQAEAKLTVGLSAIHHFLSNESEQTTASPAMAQEVSLDEVSMGEIGSPAVEQEIIPLHETVQYESYPCRVLDSSVRGYGVRWMDERGSVLKINDLVAIGYLHFQSRTRVKEDNAWKVGVIRWMRTESDHSLQFGIEVIARSVEAVSLSTAGSTAMQGGLSALLLPEDKKQNIPASIVAPSLYAAGKVLNVATGMGVQEVRLTKKLEEGGAFKRFQFLLVEKESHARVSPQAVMPTKAKASAGKAKNDLDDLLSGI